MPRGLPSAALGPGLILALLIVLPVPPCQVVSCVRTGGLMSGLATVLADGLARALLSTLPTGAMIIQMSVGAISDVVFGTAPECQVAICVQMAAMTC